MGCYHSKTVDPISPDPGGASDSHIRDTNTSLPSELDNFEEEPDVSSSRLYPGPRPLAIHINKPLARHKWTSTERRWTKEQLRRERIDFFDTRVSGRQEIWQAIRAAIDVMQGWDHEILGGWTVEGLATAQSILFAAEISLPTGDLANGVYDSFGNYYQLPQWVVSDPDNMIVKNEGDHQAEETTSEAGTHHSGGQGQDPTIRSHEKIIIRTRLSVTGRDLDIEIDRSESLRDLIRKLGRQASLSPDHEVRIAYMGKLLKDTKSLEAQGWQQNHVVNAFVFDRS
ncbi:Ubiquitin supergroup [Moelleriella libera RCEF 2490]|uniref:Ubiquitin supergroup n=1 Tax=Moelleriella libera RCEF 2490 TaxID=1081109 RepID=A0A166PDW0_9HYPO|nr:Ubiquitin supergroup [Moelleriella libera RCEF 2490]